MTKDGRIPCRNCQLYNKSVALKLPRDLWRRVKFSAAEHNCILSQIVQQAIREHLQIPQQEAK